MNKFLLIKHLFITMVSVLTLASCGNGDAPKQNSGDVIQGHAPRAEAVEITPNQNVLPGLTVQARYTFIDTDGDLEGGSLYSWRVNGQVVADQTTTEFRVDNSHIGSQLQFCVTPISASGLPTQGDEVCSEQSGVIQPGYAPLALHVAITPSSPVTVGHTLEGQYTYLDAEGDLEGDSMYSWRVNNTVLNTENSRTYVLTNALVGEQIEFCVTPIALTGEVLIGDEVCSDFTDIIVPDPNVGDAPYADPVIALPNTNIAIGQKILGLYNFNDINGDLEENSTYQWLANETELVGETSRVLAIPSSTLGQQLKFCTTPVAGTGTPFVGDQACSVKTDFVREPTGSAPVAVNVTSLPNSNVSVGDTLTGNYTYDDVDNDPEGASSFRWLADDEALSGQNTISLVLSAFETEGKHIQFCVTPVSYTGTPSTGEEVCSAPSSTVLPANGSAPAAADPSVFPSVNITVGQLLVSSYGYSDNDGDLEGNSRYRWLADDVEILGANNRLIRLAQSTLAKQIQFCITPVALTGIPNMGTESCSPKTTVVVDPIGEAPVASDVAMTPFDDLEVGQTIMGEYTYTDADNDLEADSLYSWLLNGDVITDQTTQSITLIAAYEGKQLQFCITPVSDTGTPNVGEEVCSAESNLILPTLGSAPQALSVQTSPHSNLTVGDVVRGQYVYQDADSDLEGTSTYRWFADDAVLIGLTTQNIVLKPAQTEGKQLQFCVTPKSLTGEPHKGLEVCSAKTGIVNPLVGSAPTAHDVTVEPTNNLVVGATVTGLYVFDDIDNDAEGESTYQWLADDVVIPNQTKNTLTLHAAQTEGKQIQFCVTPVSATGTPTVGSLACSAKTAIVEPITGDAPIATDVEIAPSTGLTVGDMLTATYTYSDVDDDAEGSSIYIWKADGVEIADENSESITLSAAASEGKSIQFCVTPVSATGTPKTGLEVCSLASDVIAPAVGSAPTATSLIAFPSEGITVGQTLISSYIFNDVDGDLEATSIFSWQADGSDITNETRRIITLSNSVEGQQIAFCVTPVSATGVPVQGAKSCSPATEAVAKRNGDAPVASNVLLSSTTLMVGDSVTGTYDYSDADADLEGSSVFKWRADGDEIANETSQTLLLTATEMEGKQIQFCVVPVALTGLPEFGEEACSALSNVVAPLVGNKPTATDVDVVPLTTLTVGEIVAGDYVFNDIDGDLEARSSYSWRADGVDIPGQVFRLMRLKAAQTEGKQIQFCVTPLSATGLPIEGDQVCSAQTTPIDPKVGTAPTASHVLVTPNTGLTIGDTITATYDYDDLDNDAEGSSIYSWRANGVVIPDQNDLDLVLDATETEGKTVEFCVVPVSLTGIPNTGVLTCSAATDVIAPLTGTAPIAINLNVIPDVGLVVGTTVSGEYTYSDFENDLEGSSTFSWYADGVLVSGETGLNLTPSNSLEGAKIQFCVTPVAASGLPTQGVQECSLPTAAILPKPGTAPVADSVTVSPSSSITVNDTLTATYAYNDADSDLEGSSTYIWQADGNDILTEVTQTLVLNSPFYEGKQLTFCVTPVALTGTPKIGTQVCSAQTTAVLPVLGVAPEAQNLATDRTSGITVGEVLNGTYDFFDADTDAEGISEYYWAADNQLILNQSTQALAISAMEEGKQIRFCVRPVAETGLPKQGAVECSAPTDAVLPASGSAPEALSVIINEADPFTVGDSITGGYVYSDADSDLEGVSLFQWQADDTDIAGATTDTYQLTVNEQNKTIKYCVTPVAITGLEKTGLKTCSAASQIVQPASGSAPTASSVLLDNTTPTVGDMITGSYLFSDVDGDLEGTSTYEWLADGLTIPNENAISITLTASAAEAKTIAFCITPVSATGTPTTGSRSCSSASDPTLPLAGAAPTANTVEVSPSTGLQPIMVVSGSYIYADADNDLEGNSIYSWKLDGTTVLNANSLFYVLTAAESEGKTVEFCVEPVAKTGTPVTDNTVYCSTPTAPVSPRPGDAPIASNVVFTGTAIENGLLQGAYDYADSDNDLEGTSTYQWKESDDTLISGETNLTITLGSSLVGKQVKFCITPVAQTGTPNTGNEVCSANSSVVAPAAGLPPTATPSITVDETNNLPLEGVLLTGSYIYNAPDGFGEGASTEVWKVDGSNISSSTYTVTADDIGDTLEYCVTPVNVNGVFGPEACTNVTGAGVVIEGSLEYGSSLTATIYGLPSVQTDWYVDTDTAEGPLDDDNPQVVLSNSASYTILASGSSNAGYYVGKEVMFCFDSGTVDYGTQCFNASEQMTVDGGVYYDVSDATVRAIEPTRHISSNGATFHRPISVAEVTHNIFGNTIPTPDFQNEQMGIDWATYFNGDTSAQSNASKVCEGNLNRFNIMLVGGWLLPVASNNGLEGVDNFNLGAPDGATGQHLQSLFDNGLLVAEPVPALDPDNYISVNTGWPAFQNYWSSAASGVGNNYAAEFRFGSIQDISNTQALYVSCVR